MLVSAGALAAELLRAISISSARGNGAQGSQSSAGWPSPNSCAASGVRWSAAHDGAREWQLLDRAALEQRGALALANWPSVREVDREQVCLQLIK